jgi:hypothetical protein
MKIDYYKQIPEVQVIDYIPSIPFYRGMLIAEYTLTGGIEDIMYPAPVRENKVPVPGTTVLYRIIGNGSDLPSFSGFNPTTNSSKFDITLNAVNLIEFLFDGVDYWYTVRAGLAAADPIIIDKGLGDGVITITLKYTISMPIQATLGDTARSTLKECIQNVHYTGTNPLTYYLRKSGDPNWIQGTDPLLIFIDWNCSELGTQQIEAYVSDGYIESPFANASVVVQDNDGSC